MVVMLRLLILLPSLKCPYMTQLRGKLRLFISKATKALALIIILPGPHQSMLREPRKAPTTRLGSTLRLAKGMLFSPKLDKVC